MTIPEPVIVAAGDGLTRAGSQNLVGEWVRLIPTLWTENGEDTYSKGISGCSNQKKEGRQRQHCPLPHPRTCSIPPLSHLNEV